MRRSVIIVLVLLALLVDAGCSIGAAPGRAVHQFEIQVNVRGGGKFSGNYMVVMPDGSSQSRSIEGAGYASYRASGSMVSCVFQKQADDSTMMLVTILRDGTIVASSNTAAAYGMVSVATP